ncbi:hypothetical protein PENTCL1PPCAC_15281, partial [Pristionchus entomophagus]
ILILAIITAHLLFIHIFHTLHRKRSKGSAAALRKISRSTIILTVQLGIPGIFIILPGLIICMGVISQVFPFELCLSVVFLLPLHPIAHNVILLGI